MTCLFDWIFVALQYLYINSLYLPMRFYITLLLLCLPLVLPAQTNTTWLDLLDHIGQGEDIDRGQLEQLYDDLADLADNKIDINTCSREDLLRLPFLSEQQVMDIMEYRYKVKHIETYMELYLVPSLDRNTILLLKEFLNFSPAASSDTIPSLRKIANYGKHELTADFKLPFYDRAGDKNGYLGYKYRHWMRYTFSYRQNLKVGLVASQDAGEPFLAGENKAGYDYYSFFFLLRDIRRLKALAVGRYRLRFGMGLILNSSYSFGKLVSLSNLYSSTNYITGHSSRSEANYLQGIAATIDLGRGFEVSTFASYRKLDATLTKDSASVATILRTGYHRTQSEMDRRRNTSETLFGGNLHFFSNGFHLGATAFYTRFSRLLSLNSSGIYRRWYPHGQSFWNASIDYGYVSNRLNISGETATGDCRHVATVNTASYMLNSRLSLIALQRYYPYQYYSLHSESFSEGGAVNDESGIFVGAKWQPWRNSLLQAYTDISYFAWPKYGVSQASHRWDNFVQLTVTGKHWVLTARYRMKVKEMNNDDDTGLTTTYTQRARLAGTYTNGIISLKTQADVSLFKGNGHSNGYMLTENAIWNHRWLRLGASCGYFQTSDYNSRVYSYEPGMLYSFYYPSFYGHGLRATINAKAKVGNNLLLVAKLGTTHYFDRDTISSGLQAINGSTQTDFELQVKWRFSGYRHK